MAEFDSYIAAWRERRARNERARVDARERAMALARELADVLVTRYGASRVVLVGSLARGDFAPGSDIDLAAEGVPDDRFFAAGAYPVPAERSSPLPEMPREPQRERGERAHRVGRRAERHHRHVAHIQVIRTHDAEIFVDGGVLLEGPVVGGAIGHAEAAGGVMHGARAEALAALTELHVIVRCRGRAVVAELPEDAPGHAVEHGEDGVVVLVPAGERREARVAQVVHPLQVPYLH
jgi:predicted nucleotidyltransferase